ncbi:Photosystem II reaction center W protein, chloroplastic [Hordeum vulgare]|nr:Photosystem II reaction center W protein, chloroplastic [Hordeum vulgare]
MAKISTTAVVLAARPSRAAELPQLRVARAARPSRAAELPRLRVARAARLRCSYSKDLKKKASPDLAPVVANGEPPLAPANAMSAAAALALVEVDERMSAERTWLSDNLLGWVLLGAVGLVLSFHSVYSYIVDDGEQSGGGGIAL